MLWVDNKRKTDRNIKKFKEYRRMKRHGNQLITICLCLSKAFNTFDFVMIHHKNGKYSRNLPTVKLLAPKFNLSVIWTEFKC